MWNLLDSGPQEFRAGQGSRGSTRHRRGREREGGLTLAVGKGGFWVGKLVFG